MLYEVITIRLGTREVIRALLQALELSGRIQTSFVERELFAVVRRERLIDPAVCALENLQYTIYHPGGS